MIDRKVKKIDEFKSLCKSSINYTLKINERDK